MFDNDVRIGGYTKLITTVVVPFLAVSAGYLINAAVRVYTAAQKVTFYTGKVAKWEGENGWSATRKVTKYGAKLAKWTAKEASRYEELSSWSTAFVIASVVALTLLYINRHQIRDMYRSARGLDVLPR